MRRFGFLKAVTLVALLAATPGLPRAATDPAGLSIADLTAIETVTGYLNDIRTMQGSFVQTAPDGQVTQGDFFIERPGKMRFEYALPSHLTVISDGSWVAVQDRKLQTSEKYRLSATPLRMFLSQEVDLLNDARILGVDPDDEERISITVQDPSGEADGTLTLYFDRAENQLASWTVSDAQGLDTHIEFQDVVRGEPIDPDTFRIIEDDGFDFDDNDL